MKELHRKAAAPGKNRSAKTRAQGGSLETYHASTEEEEEGEWKKSAIAREEKKERGGQKGSSGRREAL